MIRNGSARVLATLALMASPSAAARMKNKQPEMLADDVANSITAEGKLEYYWGQITANTTSKPYMGKLKTLRSIMDRNFLQNMQDLPSETMPEGHHKSTHGPGGHAKVHFEWLRNNNYTGLFQKADNCVIRIANAAEPARGLLGWLGKTAYNPNMGIKCYRDGAEGSGKGAESANVLTIWEIDGYNVLPEGKARSCSFFDVSMSNHCGDRDDVSMVLKDTFLNAFRRVTSYPLMLGVSSFAEATQAGQVVDKPDFPFALVFKPHASLKDAACEFNDFMVQLTNVGAQRQGKVLYEVYAVRDPWSSRPQGSPDLQHIGNMVLDEGFTRSQYGDSQLFFRHRFMETEMAILEQIDGTRHAAWQAYTGSDWVKEEGAAWYEPFL